MKNSVKNIFRKLRLLKCLIVSIVKDIKFRISYLKNYNYSNDEEVLFTQLRKYAHILDKGLHIVPFEKGHSTQIYQQCLTLKNRITNKEIKIDPAYEWIESIIKKYEQAQLSGVVDKDRIMHPSFTEVDKNILYNIIKSRVSCRNFSQELILDDIWNEIIGVATDAPTSCCRQITRYYIENDKNTLEMLAKNIAGATGFNENIPYLICVTSDIRSFSLNDHHCEYIDASLSIEIFLLACTVNNIYTTPLIWQYATTKEDKNVRNILNIPDYEKIILFIAAGTPNILPEKPARINVSWIRKR